MSPIVRNSGRTGLRPISVKPQTNSPGDSTPEHVVNNHTLRREDPLWPTFEACGRRFALTKEKTLDRQSAPLASQNCSPSEIA